MTVVAKKTIEYPRVVHPSSFRFRARTHDRLNYYSKILNRKKISLVDEALNKMFDEEEKKEGENIELLKLLKAGDESGSAGEIPTLEKIKALAKKRHPHNHSE